MENTLDLVIAEHLRDLHRAGWSLDELAAYLTVIGRIVTHRKRRLNPNRERLQSIICSILSGHVASHHHDRARVRRPHPF